jgi:hypothetical protein
MPNRGPPGAGLMKVDLGRGAPTFVARRHDNGVTIHQGASRIMLAPDELAAVLAAIQELTNGQCSPSRAEKTMKVDHI